MNRVSSRILRGAAIAALLALSSVAACKTSSQWQFVRYGQKLKVTTRVTVRTEPSGAEVSINGKYLGVSPLEVPIRYVKSMKVYSRRNYMPPGVEERELPNYEHNHHRLTVFKVGYRPAEKEIVLKGEEELEVPFELKERPD
jgi:hypothetical protein